MGKTVLVVDDEPDIRALVSAVLDAAGYAVREAEDGEEALAEVGRATPDLVLSDVRMPRLDGVGLVTRLRQGAIGVPVVLMTAQQRTSPVPGVPCVAKPFAIEQLLGAVSGALG